MLCLQEARHEAGELKAELDNLKANNARRNFGKEGNSLFGEVSYSIPLKTSSVSFCIAVISNSTTNVHGFSAESHQRSHGCSLKTLKSSGVIINHQITRRSYDLCFYPL